MAVVFKPDWSVNVANITVIAVAIMGAIGAWYDVKSETKSNSKDILVIQQQHEKMREEYVSADLRQDHKRDTSSAELREIIRETTREINSNIRDLRTDLRVAGKSRGP